MASEDEMVRGHPRLSGHESEQTPGDSEGQGSLVCCSSWGRKESATTQQMKTTVRANEKQTNLSYTLNHKHFVPENNRRTV